MKTVISMDVWLKFEDNVNTCINMSVQESYNLLMMPSMTGLISSMVPVYGLPPVSEPENEE